MGCGLGGLERRGGGLERRGREGMGEEAEERRRRPQEEEQRGALGGERAVGGL